MSAKSNQRSWKNYLIRRDVQLPVITTNLIFLLAVVGLMVLVLLSPLYIDMLNADDYWMQQITGNLFLVLLERIAIAILAVLVLAAGHQIIFSHRFCGPLVNFSHSFARMSEADFSRKIHLRKNDFLKSEADQVNAVINRLNADGTTMREELAEIAGLLEGLAGQALPDEAQQAIAAIQPPIDRLRQTVSAWKLAADA